MRKEIYLLLKYSFVMGSSEAVPQYIPPRYPDLRFKKNGFYETAAIVIPS